LRNLLRIKSVSNDFLEYAGFSLYLNELRKNLAVNLERFPLTHSDGYGPAGNGPTLFARFPLSFVPFMKYPG